MNSRRLYRGAGRRHMSAADLLAFEVIRGGDARAQMITLNRDNPAAIDERMLSMKPALEDAVKDHSAL